MFLKHFFHLNIISKRCFQIHSSFQHFPQPFLTQIFKTGNFYCQNASLSVSPSCSPYYISNICKKKKSTTKQHHFGAKFLLQLCTKHEAIDPWPLISMKQCILLSGSQWAAASVLDSTLEESSKEQPSTYCLPAIIIEEMGHKILDWHLGWEWDFGSSTTTYHPKCSNTCKLNGCGLATLYKHKSLSRRLSPKPW